MTKHPLSSIGMPGDPPPVNGIATMSPDAATIDVHDVNAHEDFLLRQGNGIKDEIAFPRLRAQGVADAELHSTAMHLVRQVQCGSDRDGRIAQLLGVVRCGVYGTDAAPGVMLAPPSIRCPVVSTSHSEVGVSRGDVP